MWTVRRPKIVKTAKNVGQVSRNPDIAEDEDITEIMQITEQSAVPRKEDLISRRIHLGLDIQEQSPR